RLLGAVRLLDMLLSDDGQIGWYVDEFFKGNYTFERGAGEGPAPEGGQKADKTEADKTEADKTEADKMKGAGLP
ncbi:MAG: hypothetical protein C0405_14005, partial [Desulfovibrio sp.]|nr:hypothetical protein [Desulfovibrio sp.]